MTPGLSLMERAFSTGPKSEEASYTLANQARDHW